MNFDVILRVTTKPILPFVLLFALYVHFHADFGPGGGFQAGVIASGMVILYAIVFGAYAAKRAVPRGLVHAMVPLGVLIYASAGLPAFLSNYNFFNFGVLASKPDYGHHIGIIWVEVGVIMTVAGSMLSIFYALTERGRT